MFLTAIRQLFSKPQKEALAASLEGLEARVRHLEGEQIALLSEWAKTRDQVIRYMKRTGQWRAEIKRRDQLELDDELEEELDDELDDAVARAKGMN